MASLAPVTFPQQVDVSLIVHTLWTEVGSELILLTLFCTGFLVFRSALVRELIPGGVSQRRGKSLKDPVSAPPSPTSAAGDLPVDATAPRTPAGTRKLPRQEARREGSVHADAAVAAHEARIRAAVAARRASEAIRAMADMASSGATLPGQLVASVLELADAKSPPLEAGCSAAVCALRALTPGALSSDAIGSLLHTAAHKGDIALLREVCRCASNGPAALPATVCEALLRSRAAIGDGNGVEMFDALVQAGYEPHESTLTAVVSMCAESKHVPLAEHVVAHARRAHGRVLLPLYSALIKVYGQARLWHKTCELYVCMKREEVVPDTVAYGALIKAAVESGRTELAQELFRESGNPDLLNYMSLIRAAGRERDLPKALRLLKELERSPLAADATTYNCALEACVACGDRAAAEGLFRRMARDGHIDVVSYNTYLKLLLAAGDQSEANAVLREMNGRGFPPNVVTYNSLIRDAVGRQDLDRAWSIVQAMERNRVRPDAFTCSILMKGVKQCPSMADVDRVIDLIRRERITPDEVLVNCLLDACVRLRDPQRITQVLEQFKATGVVPSLHAYATLIRAYGHARRCDRAWDLWQELRGSSEAAETGASPPEEAFVAMVEALLAGGDLKGACCVFREAGAQLSDLARAPSVFAACVKACVQYKQVQLALELYADTKDNFICSKVTFNCLIDAFVRQGDMAGANELFRDMTLKNVTPDLITYSTLIKGHCSRGDLEQGLQLLGLMQRRGLKPDAVLFNSILDGCAHKQMRTLTEQVLLDMQAAGISPSNFTVSTLVKLYGRCGDLDAAFGVVDAFPDKYGFQVNAQVLTCLMSACIANGEFPRAVGVYENMSSYSCKPDAKTYQTLLTGCLRASDVACAANILKDVLACGAAATLECDVVDSALLLAVRRGHAADIASPLLEALVAGGAQISQRTVAAVRRGAVGSPAAADIGDMPAWRAAAAASTSDGGVAGRDAAVAVARRRGCGDRRLPIGEAPRRAEASLAQR